LEREKHAGNGGWYVVLEGEKNDGGVFFGECGG